ncbi:hypothetical protein CPB83DRAFT_858788 [Crepidotus variabilis]|uniref:F-box domain-containing protein n=1 Tax=Crepidotus variabilis TaxID=179855 RepID=A0A9P6EBI1_9AGAR|nr:hypothetical protein CPB83DRAFT_858788 [Crepidotus variabilis]
MLTLYPRIDFSSLVTTSTNPTLPPELLHQIFGFLHPDIDGLMACSEALSTTNLRGLSDSWLYRDVCVYTGNLEFGGKGTKMLHLHSSELYQLLQSNNRGSLKNIIRSLCITLRSTSGAAEITPLLSNPLLTPRLHAITLTAAKGRIILWQRCDAAFQKSLLKRLTWTGDGNFHGKENGVIKELAVRATQGFPLPILEKCLGLTRVYLDADFSIMIRPAENIDAKIDLVQPCLYDLSVQRQPLNVLNWFTYPNVRSMISTLRCLDIGNLTILAWREFSNLLEGCKDTLQQLTVDLRQAFSVWTDDASLDSIAYEQLILTPDLVGLRELTVLVGITSTAQQFVSTPPTTLDGPGYHVSRRYATSLQSVGILLKKWWFDPLLVNKPNMKAIEVQVDFTMSGVDPPNLAEIDFQDLYLSNTSITTTPDPLNPPPLINLNFISAKHDTSPIPFSTLRADIERNEILSVMILNGELKVSKRTLS